LLSAAQEESSAARLNNSMECTLIFMFLSFKFATKVKMEGRAAGKENAEAGKRRSKKGKMHPE